MIDAYGLGNGGDVEQALSAEGAMEALGLRGEATRGLILALSQGLASQASQVKGTTNGGHQRREVGAALRADLFALKRRLARWTGMIFFTHFSCLNKSLPVDC